MPAFELNNASLQDYGSQLTNDSSQISSGLRSMSQDYLPATTKGRTGYYAEDRSNDLRSVRSDPQSIAKTAFTNFTESLSSSSEELQHGVKKTFSSIVNSFSRDGGSSKDTSSSSSTSSESETDSSDSSTTNGGGRNGGGGGLDKIKSWTDFAFGDALKSRVSSLTSRSSSYNTADSSNQSTLSSHSASPRMNADNIKITVDNSGLVLRESSDESSNSCSETTNSSVSSWQDTASRDRSLLDTIGESSRDEDENDESSSSDSGSGSDGDEGLEVDDRGIHYDYDDDSTEFNSEVGLEDLGAVMMQIGSCQFEPESTSLSFDEDYSYSSGMFPPVVSNYLAAKLAKSSKGDNHRDENDENEENDAGFFGESSNNGIFMRRIYNSNKNKHHNNDGKTKGGIASFFVSAKRRTVLMCFESSFRFSLTQCLAYAFRTKRLAAAPTFNG